MTDAILAITNGTTRVDLINPSSGFHLISWNPAITDYKGGGVFQNPPLADWRQLRVGKWETAIESMELHINGANPDGAAVILQELRQLLEEANQYWTTDWQNNPVWVEAKAKCETNTRYAVIAKGRLASDRNYFNQPFTGQIATMQNLPLQIERRAWLSNQPGTGTATNISAVQYYDSQWCIDFDGSGDSISCGSDASIDDLPSGANGFTAEAWIRPKSSGENSGGRVFDKSQWIVATAQITDNLSMSFQISAATTNATARAVNTPSLYSGWHHVAITYNDNTDRLIHVWIDGVEVEYASQVAASGALSSDAASTLYIGNNSASTRCFDGCIAWCRLSDTVRYTGTFTPDELCSPPAIDGNTVAQWNMTEGSGATIDNAEGTAASDGTITNAVWASDPNYEGCGRAYGNVDDTGTREVTTANEVYIANKHNLANLTDIYNYDASLTTFSSNLLDAALPTTLFPATAAAGDIVYFGINAALPDSGPFCSLVFDIATAAAATTSFTLIWEYWNGATWLTLSTQDNTDSFQNTGVNSVHWSHPLTWGNTTINSIDAFWVRVRISALTGTFTNPTQQNRNIYSIVWPYVEIQQSEVGGDITALAKLQITPVADVDGPSGSSPNSYINYLIAGLRSTSRGEDFTAYLNCSDEQNHPDIAVSLGTGASFDGNNIILAPTGTLVDWSPGGAVSMADRVLFTINKPLAQEFFGIFHAYIYVAVNASNNDDFQYQLRVKTGTAGVSFSTTASPAVTLGTTDSLVDMGEIIIQPPIMKNGETIDKLEIAIQGSATATATRTLFIELILIPTDESVFESIDNENDSDSTVENGRYLRIDSLIPKQNIISTIHETIDNDTLGKYQSIASSPSALQKNARQRIWFFSARYNSVGSTVLKPSYFIAHKVQLQRNQRYLSLRGEN